MVVNNGARVWAIIPARGGSKGIPGKNLQIVNGHSLIARAVRAACGANHVEQVFVSTDDAAIATAARAAGATIIDRPAEIAGDTASSESALLHTLDLLEERGETLPPLIAFLQCTSPFVQSADVDGTVDALIAEGADSALAVTGTHAFLWRRTADGAIGVNHDKSKRPRRQEREPEFIETGAVYVMKTEGFRAARHRFFGRTAIYAMPALRAMEIDEPMDLEIARAISSHIEGTA